MASALVTGGSSGIGLAIARMLSDEGFDLTLASRTAAKIDAAAAELGAHPVTADMGKEDDCIRVVAEHETASAAWTSSSTRPGSGSRAPSSHCRRSTSTFS